MNITQKSKLGIIFSLISIPAIFFVVMPLFLPPVEPTVSMHLSNIVKWFLALSLIGYVIYTEKKELSSIGFRKPSFLIAVSFIPATLVTIIAVGYGTSFILEFTGWSTAQADAVNNTISRMTLVDHIIISITAGVTEEILYRGYPIERLTEIIGNKWIAGIITALSFIAIHIPTWGIGAAVSQTLATIVFTGYYLFTRNLWVLIAMHILYDLILIIVF